MDNIGPVIINYLYLAFLLFFITFFIDIFYHYFRYQRIVPRKMFTFKPGGLFEHYRIVLFVLLVLGLLHAAFGLTPFPPAEEEPNIVAIIVQQFIFFVPLTIFFIFLFVFIFYVIFAITARARKLEPDAKKQYLIDRGHFIVRASFVLGLVFGIALFVTFNVIL